MGIQNIQLLENFNDPWKVQPSGFKDLEIYRTTGELIFSDWLSSSATNAAAVQSSSATGFGPSTLYNHLDLDKLYLPIDLGITSFIPLAHGGTDPSVDVFFRAPRARVFMAPDPT